MLEKALRSALFRKGYRFCVHRAVPGDRRRTIDFAFVAAKVAVFVDGCFWHGCPTHGTWPSRNADFWREKIETNRRRDRDTDARLQAAGWRSVRIWEHDTMAAALNRIERELK